MSTDVPTSAPELVGAVRSFVAALDTPAGHTASGLASADLAALTRTSDALADAISARDDAERAYRAAVKTAEAAFDAAEGAFRPARRQAANHAAMTPDLRASAGLPPTGDRTGPAPLPTIADLTALPRPSGAVFLDWTGPTGGSLRYEVFVAPLDGDGAPGGWTLVGSATATDFTHRDARPGARSAYRVEAVRGERRGEPSNEAAVHA